MVVFSQNRNGIGVECGAVLGFDSTHVTQSIGRLRVGGFRAEDKSTLMVTSFTYVGECALLTIVHVGDGDFALGHVIVVIDVVGQHTLIYSAAR